MKAVALAWVQHMVASMDPIDGRCAVILPQGVLFHNDQKDMREKLVRSDKLEAVITLAGGVFYGAGVSACILFLNNNKPEHKKGKVILINGDNVFTHIRAQNIVTEEQVEQLYKYYSDYEDVIDYAKVVAIDDIAEKEFTLSVNTYIEKTKVEMESVESVKKR